MKESPGENNKILIGFLSKTIKGSIPTITNTYLEKLKHKFRMIPFYMERRKGSKNLADLNSMNLFYLIKHYLEWCAAIITNKPNIAHFPVTSFWNMEKSLLFLTTARILGVKYTIGHLHGGAFIEFWNQLGELRKYIAVKQMRKLDIMIVLSESWKSNMIKYVGIEEGRIRVLNNLIDNKFEDHFRDFKRDYYAQPPVTVLGFNIMDSRKGLFDLLDATVLLKVKANFQIVIIGDEREPNVRENALRKIKEESLQNIHLLEGIWNDGKTDWFEKADILVLPSHIENFPVVVIEAASAGIPVIASKLGALPDIFTNNHDILFIEPKDILQLGRHLEYLLNNPDERRRLGENIRRTFEEKLTGSKIIDLLEGIYNSLN